MAPFVTPTPFVPLVLLLVLQLPPPLLPFGSALTADGSSIADGSGPASRDDPPPPLPDLSAYANHAELQSHTLHVYWSVDGTGNGSASSIRMGVVARTAGWVALGLSEIGAMVGSDVVVGWVAGGRLVVTDRFIFNKSRGGEGVALDAQQDVHAVAGREWHDEGTGDVWTELHFWRRLDTGDCNDRVIRPGEHVSLIWALGSTDEMGFHGLSRGSANLVMVPGVLFPIRGAQPPSTAISHTNHVSSSSSSISALGSGPLQRKGRKLIEIEDSPGWLNLTVPTYEVSPNATVSYICNTFDVPFMRKRHAIEWGMLVNSTRPESVHHIVLFACDPGDQPPTTPNFDCVVLRGEWGCTNSVVIRNRGGLPIVLPDNVGMPFGPGGYQRLMMQMHYTNYKKDTTIVDRSGIYLRMAPSLREHDAGVMTVGPFFYNWLINIPPHQPAWGVGSVCPGECTQRVLGDRPNVTIFSSLVHMHAAGKQVYTELYRNGTKLLEINRQDYYDFEYQQFKDQRPGLYLLPGDELRTYCTWDTSDRNETTRGGPSSHDEMCVDYLLYYPASITHNFGYGCFNACLPSPTMPPAQRVDMCAAGLNNMIWHNETCSLTFRGHPSSYVTIAGCSHSLAPSLSSLLDSPSSSSIMTVPATVGPSGHAPKAPCIVTSMGSGTEDSFSSCRSLGGGFFLFWNISLSDRVSHNATITFAFRGRSQGYIAVGMSPHGRMVGSSVVAAWGGPSAADVPQVSEFYLGGYSRSEIWPGGNVSFRDIAVDMSDEDMIIRGSMSIPSAMAASNVTLIWSKGEVVNNFVAGHAPSDSHTLTLNFTIDVTASTPPIGRVSVTVWSQQLSEFMMPLLAVPLIVFLLSMLVYLLFATYNMAKYPSNT